MKICATCNCVYSNTNQKFCQEDGGSLQPLKTLNDRYEIIKQIGKGGMGAVYHATDKHLDRECAIKVINTFIPSNEKEAEMLNLLTERFKSEAIMSCQLNQANIITTYDYGVTKNGLYFIAMEFLKGESLDDLLQREKTLPLDRAIPIIKQCVDALIEAHSKDIIHRDLKPSNLFIINKDNRDRVKLLDFGIAKAFSDKRIDLTKTGLMIGTPAFMSPEQVKGEKELDGRSDLYSLALIIYKMLSGRLPFQGKTLEEIAVARLIQDPIPFKQSNPDIDIPVKLEDVIMRALAREREDRIGGAKEFFQQLVATTSNIPAPAPHLPTHLQSGLKHYQQGKYDEAIDQFSEALKANAALYYQRGLVHYDRGEYQQAVIDFSQAVKLDANENYYYHCALACYHQADYSTAIDLLTQAINLNPDFSYYYYLRGKAHLNQQRYQQAVTDFAQVTSLAPQEAANFYQLALAYLLNRDFPQAITNFTEAISLNAEHAKAYHHRGLAYFRIGHRKEALQDLQASLKIDDDPDVRECYRLATQKPSFD